MTDQVESKPKRSFSIVGLLRLVAIILAVIVFLLTAITSLLTAYVIFAPDDMPKPFYLMYYLPGQSPQLPIAAGQTTPQPSNAKTPGASEAKHTTTPSEENGSSGEQTTIMPGQGVLLDTGSKIINLSDPSGRTFIRTTVILEFQPNDLEKYNDKIVPTAAGGGGEGAAAPTELTSPSQAYITKFKEELTAHLPMINDVIITLLSTKTFNQIYTSEGKETLRQELIQALNSRLIGYKVIQVYFNEFVVQ
jgi:flagellar basal body-associated protein FliL